MKEAKTTYTIHPNLNKRWSPRASADKQIKAERERKEMNEFVFENTFEQPSELIK